MFYINTITVGGAERAIIQLAHNFYKEGYRSILVTSFTSDGEYSLPQGIERVSIEKKELKQSRIKRNINRIRGLKSLCKKYRPEALISFMAEPNFRAIAATRFSKVKSIVSVRSDPEEEYKGKLRRFIGKHIITKADGCVFQTEDAKSWFPKEFQKKSAVILNQVSDEFFSSKYRGGTNIITVGRLSQAKNQRLLIEAFSKVASEFPDVNLEIFGSGDEKGKLIEFIKACSIEERVFLKGQIDNVSSVLSQARLFVLSSNVEGMPNALMEALSVGVPCISTDCPCGGPRSLIKDGKNGILVPVGDVDMMANAIRRVLSDKEFARFLSVNAKKESENYKAEFVFAKWKEYIEGVVGHND